MKDHKLNYMEELLKEVSDLKTRAIRTGYKNPMPKLPESKKFNYEQSLLGFTYRLHNWKSQLLQLENPGGMPNHKTKNTQENNDDLRNFVINSLDFKIDSDNISDLN